MYILYDKTSTWELDYVKDTLLPPKYRDHIEYLDQAAFLNLTHTHIYTNNCILVFSSNAYPYNVIMPIILHLKPRAVIHVSDEWGRTPEYSDIAFCTPLYLRQYAHASYFPTQPPPIQIPLGYMVGMLRDATAPSPPSARKYAWSFIGNMKHDRAYMVQTFKTTLPTGIAQNGLSAPEMYTVYMNSVFVLSGRGNVTLDCFRIYEAILAGAIPVIVGSNEEIAATFAFNGDMPPFVTASTWPEAASLCKGLLDAPSRLEEIQKGCLEWWKRKIGDIQEKILAIE